MAALTAVGPPVANVFALQTFSTTGAPTKTGRQQLTISVGPFGYCNSHGNKCTGASLGYDLAGVLEEATSANSDIDEALKVATKTFIVIPIACGIAFIGTVISAAGHHIGSAIWSAVCGVVVEITASVATAVCFLTLEGAAGAFRGVNGATSAMGNGRWMLMLTVVLSGFCWILGIIECCLARQHKKHRRRDVEYVPVGVTPAGQQTMGYGQSASLIANPAPMGNEPSYQDPYADRPIPASGPAATA